VDGHGAVVQERKEFAHDVTRVPFHHVDSLISIRTMSIKHKVFSNSKF
jgi:hypothetical protein